MKFNITKKTGIILLIILALSIILNIQLMAGLTKNKNCFENPFVYGASKLAESSNSNVICNCFFTSPEYAPFSFDKEGVIIQK